MISTQLDLFGGPPKPPKNIREEEPPIVVPRADDKAIEPPSEPEREIPVGISDEPVLEVVQEPVHEEMPEWIDEPVMETDAEMDEEPAYEPYQDIMDVPLEEYVPEIEDESEDEPEDVDSTYVEPISEIEEETDTESEPDAVDLTLEEPTPEIEEETDTEFEPEVIDLTLEEPTPEIEEGTDIKSDSDSADSTFDEPTPEMENKAEPSSEPDTIEENETPLEVEDLHDKEKDAEETLAAPIPEDTVHVQLPSHHANPVIFASLIPVESFVVEEEPVIESNEIKPDISDTANEDKNEVRELESDAEDIEMHDEEPPSPPFMVEAITTGNVIIEGDAELDVEDDNTEDAQETKEGQLQIPEDEKLFLRQYYTMRETSNMFGVNQSLLRYWENEFDVLKPKKNRKGDRYFRPEDIKNLELIYHLLKVRKFTIEGAREYIKSKKKVLDTFELVQRLEKLKFFLHELKTHL